MLTKEYIDLEMGQCQAFSESKNFHFILKIQRYLVFSSLRRAVDLIYYQIEIRERYIVFYNDKTNLKDNNRNFHASAQFLWLKFCMLRQKSTFFEGMFKTSVILKKTMCKNIKSKKAKVIENMKKSLHEQEKEVEFLAVSNYKYEPQ